MFASFVFHVTPQEADNDGLNCVAFTLSMDLGVYGLLGTSQLGIAVTGCNFGSWLFVFIDL